MIQRRLARTRTIQPGARNRTVESGRAGGELRIGSGIFGLPSDVARLIGRASQWAVLLAGLAAGVIMACFAEVASQFTQAGGPYLYVRAAFGRLLGIEMGWMLWLVRLAAPAATANLFVIYCGEFWPQVTEPLPRFLILTFLYGLLTLINYHGVRASTLVSNVFTVAKLVPLFLVAIVGSIYLAAGHRAISVLPAGVGASAWLKACLLLVFAYGGFETALTPLGEARNPRRDAAFALFLSLVTCTVLYTAIQWVVIGVLPDPAHSERPLADVARLALGRGGAAFVSLGALVSVYGDPSANILGVPRITFALAENGDFPSIFAAIHPRFQTPYISIMAFALLSGCLRFSAASPGMRPFPRSRGCFITAWFARRCLYSVANSPGRPCFVFREERISRYLA